ncbi:hypothetical protein [Chryseobacterium hagamense]|uniref:Uncharacterized protein n=1 Tax=Chryseobacterium hagamense TaxID=395935 RepID=A0A511YN80_9FLAO|nr:hypothetical protein [Chryseobacterium hagamense]GEN76658.1 hypothetical protein CHA01nite_23980 [Chryseobacterium hagamense]
MLTLRCILIISLFYLPAKSQQTDWDNINSMTALNLTAVQNKDSEESSSVVMQIGNGNLAAFSINAKTDIAVKQYGDDNVLYFVNSFSDTETKTAVTAQGNNNIIDITGANSLSEGLQIHIKGDNRTVFIRNY